MYYNFLNKMGVSEKIYQKIKQKGTFFFFKIRNILSLPFIVIFRWLYFSSFASYSSFPVILSHTQFLLLYLFHFLQTILIEPYFSNNCAP